MDSTKKARVLIVDDESDLAEILASLFQLFNFETKTASDGKQAWEILQNENFEFVITDVRMPNMNGIELLKKIREKNPEEPKVFITSGFTDYTIDEMYNIGADGFFSKPFDAATLRSNVMQANLNPKVRYSQKPKNLPGNYLHNTLDSIEKANKENKFSLGKIGFFLKLKGHQNLNTKDIINFKIDFTNDPSFKSIEGVGEIKWIKCDETNKSNYEIGIEIKYLENPALDSFIEWNKNHPTPASIPNK